MHPVDYKLLLSCISILVNIYAFYNIRCTLHSLDNRDTNVYMLWDIQLALCQMVIDLYIDIPHFCNKWLEIVIDFVQVLWFYILGTLGAAALLVLHMDGD